MKVSVMECILFSLYPRKPESIAEVFLTNFLGTVIFQDAFGRLFLEKTSPNFARGFFL